MAWGASGGGWRAGPAPLPVRALQRPNSGSPGTPGVAGRVPRAPPRARGPPRPSAPPALPQCFHLPPHCGAPFGLSPPGPRARGCCVPPPLPEPSFVVLQVPGWQPWSLRFPSSPAPQTSPRPRRRSPGPPAAPGRALFSGGSAGAFLPGDTGGWAWCSPQCGLYGSPGRTKGVLAAPVHPPRPPAPKAKRKTLF